MHKIKVINLTPHTINILKRDFLPYQGGNSRKAIWVQSLKILPSGNVLNCPSYTEEEAYVEYEDGVIPLTCTTYGKPKNLPPFIPDTIYLVSDIVARKCPERNDFRVVNGIIREDGGKVIGCRSLARIKPAIDPDLFKDLKDKFATVDDFLTDGDSDDESFEAATAVWDIIAKIESSVNAKG